MSYIFRVKEWLVDTCWGSENPLLRFKGNTNLILTDEDLSDSLEYFFRKANVEVKNFQKTEKIKKVAIEKDSILFCKSRMDKDLSSRVDFTEVTSFTLQT